MLAKSRTIQNTLGVDFRACDNYKNGIEAAKKIELPCEEILFVGDTAETDIIGAKSVGMKTAWIKMGRDYSLQDKPDIEIDHVKELGPILNLF